MEGDSKDTTISNIIIKTLFPRRGQSTPVNSKPISAAEEEEEDCYEASMFEVDTLRTFSPLIVHRQIHKSNVSGRLQPTCKTHYGAVLFADISGFTRLANLLSVEQLQCHISNYFTTLFECVERFGGDILKICGDAIMIMWPLENCSETSSIEEKSACALTASLCGRELLLTCGSYHTYHGDVDIDLSLHCGVGVADVPCYWVGRASRWEFLITGDALHQIASTEPEAKSGEIVISPQAYELVKGHLGATLTPKGNYLLTAEILTNTESGTLTTVSSVFDFSDVKLEAFSTSALVPVKGLSDHPTLNFDKNRRIATAFLGLYHKSDPFSLLLLKGHAKMGRGLKYFVHRSARPRLVQMDHSLVFEMAELREVVTLFVNITGLEEDFRLLKLEMIQKVMSAIVESHATYGGSLRQFVVDDKGCVAIGALGVPHHTFEDNGVRAVHIANILRQKIQSFGKNCSIGISKGSTFCGLVGSSSRREYAMMGSSVNLAARLMSSCPLGCIIVDERVRGTACELLSFEDMGTIKAKGYADPVPIFAYQQVGSDTAASGSSSESFGDKLVIGRKSQLLTLRLAVKDFAEGARGCEHQFHFLEGEEGIGKSLLARQVAAESKDRGLLVVVVTGSESSSGTAYSLLSTIFDQVMSMQERRVRKQRESNKEKDTSMTDNEDVSLPPSPTQISTSQYNNRRLSVLDQISCEDLNRLSNSKTARFKEWISELLKPNPASARDGEVVNDLAVIHGYPVLDLVHLMAEVFKEEIETPTPSTTTQPGPSSGPGSATGPGPVPRPLVAPRMHQLLLKILIMRALKAAFGNRRTILVVENLQWCDLPSAGALIDFITSTDSGFGVFCYRSTTTTREAESPVFSTLRGACYCIPLPPLKSSEVSELVYHLTGPLYQSAVTKEKISRILTRTQGNPGLVENLVMAMRDELDRGLNPNIEDIRTPGQQSIVQRFDALDANLQLLLKTAAAIGNVFSVAALRSVYDSLAVAALLNQQMTFNERDKVGERRASSPAGSFIYHPRISSSPSNPRSSVAGEMFQRNSFIGDIDRLVDLGMFSPHGFQGVRLAAKPAKGPNEIDFTIADTPEIGIHALPWHDARGVLRRGWVAISIEKEESKKDSSLVSPPTETAPGWGSGTGARSPLNLSTHSTTSNQADERTFFKFSHPSIQSTAYSLSLQLDRVPVHAATIEFLSQNFNLSPGVEETCLYHAMHLKGNTHEILIWLFKCAVSARDTMRHKLFVRRGSQLVSVLVKLEASAGSELEDQVLMMLGAFNQKFGTPLSRSRPACYPYSLEGRHQPAWSNTDDEKNRNNNWLLSIGCIIRDLIYSMVKIGEFRTVVALHTCSERLLSRLILRPAENTMAAFLAKGNSRSNFVPKGNPLMSTKTPMGRLSLPLKALELDSDSGSETGSLQDDRTSSIGLVDNKRAAPSVIIKAFCSLDGEVTDEDGKNIDLTGVSLDAKSQAVVPSISDLYTPATFPLPGTPLASEQVLTAHVLSYVRGQEALAMWNILRGNSALGMLFAEDAISIIHINCRSECSVLNVICLPRLLALKSLCFPVSDPPSSATKCLNDAQLWASKSSEKPITESVKRFYDSMSPRLPGLSQSHRHDSGEWVVLAVKAVTLCGVGRWTAASQCFKTAQNDLKEVNCKLTLYHIRMLEAWALFVTGDLLNLHNKMRAIIQHSRQSEEHLMELSSGILLAIRFSLSCFYDAAETLITKLSGSGTPLASPMPSPRGSSLSGRHDQGQSLYLRITEAFMTSRRSSRDLSVAYITSLCNKLSARTHCTYIGGIFLFFAALSGLAVYESAMAISMEATNEQNDSSGIYVETDCDSDITDFAAADAIESDDSLKRLSDAIGCVVPALELLATRHIVLLYAARAARSRLWRSLGMSKEALDTCRLETSTLKTPHPANTLTLGTAYLKMETALCECADGNVTAATLAAEQSLALFAPYEADIEIAILKTCIKDSQHTESI